MTAMYIRRGPCSPESYAIHLHADTRGHGFVMSMHAFKTFSSCRCEGSSCRAAMFKGSKYVCNNVMPRS